MWKMCRYLLGFISIIYPLRSKYSICKSHTLSLNLALVKVRGCYTVDVSLWWFVAA